jgi:enoyl-CoA hydratase
MTEALPAPALLTADIAPSVTLVRFAKPAKRNSLSTATLTELDALLTELLNNEAVETIIFTGTDDVFLSGANIRELAQLDTDSALEFAKFGQRLFQSIANARQKTIAAINGYCMGGGMDLALACDTRVASIDAKFAHPGARLGIITGWGGTQRLPRLIGKARALDLFATARRFTAAEALDFGLIDAVGDPVVQLATDLAGSSR